MTSTAAANFARIWQNVATFYIFAVFSLSKSMIVKFAKCKFAGNVQLFQINTCAVHASVSSGSSDTLPPEHIQPDFSVTRLFAFDS